jgi:hypothetical protein
MSRRLLAVLIGFLGMIAYVAIVVALADPLVQAHWLLQVLFYALAGVAWVVPAVWLLRWGTRR